MPDKAVCKFACSGVTTHEGGAVTVHLRTQYDESLPEDQRFSRFTPSGTMEFGLDNPALAGFFEPGKSYYIELRPAP